MEFDKFKELFDESFGKVTPKEFIESMESLGYKFVDTKPDNSYCRHNFVQKDQNWKACSHCGLLTPLLT